MGRKLWLSPALASPKIPNSRVLAIHIGLQIALPTLFAHCLRVTIAEIKIRAGFISFDPAPHDSLRR